MHNKKVADIVKDGEKIGELKHGDRILKAESINFLKETIELNKKESFIKLYTKPLFELSKSLTGIESQFINYLLQYVSYKSGILIHVNGDKLTRNYMAAETGLNLRTIDRMLNNLVKKQILGKHKTGRSLCFTVNPFIFMKGNRVNETLVKLFENTKWAKMYKK
ncbi:MAG: replication/maintenance protein RepL [Syntrophothermus sp.]